MPQRISAEEAKKRGLTPTRITAEEAAARGLKPSAPSIPKEPEPAAEPSALETIGRGLHQGATRAWGDELVGVIGAGAEALGLNEGLGESIFPEDNTLTGRMGRAYSQNTDDQRELNKAAAEANPKLDTASRLVGAFAAPRLPGTKGMGLGKLGGVEGALYGAGESEAQDAGGLLLDTGASAITGGVTGRLMQGIGNRLKPWLAKGAEVRAVRAAGAQKPDFTDLAKGSRGADKTELMRKLGRRLLDEKSASGKPMLGRFDNPEKLAPKIEGARGEVGEMIGATVQRIQDETADVALKEGSIPGRPVNMVTIGRALLKEADEAAKQPGMAKYAAALKREAETILAQADKRVEAGDYISLTLPEAEQAKQALARQIKPSAWLDMEAAPAAQATKDAARAFRKSSEDAMEAMKGPEELSQFKALKDRYGDLKKLAKISERGQISEAARMPIGLTEQNSALLAAATGGVPLEQMAKAGAAAVGSRLNRGRGDAFFARGMDDLTRVSGDGLTRTAAQSLTSDEEQRRRLLELLAKGR